MDELLEFFETLADPELDSFEVVIFVLVTLAGFSSAFGFSESGIIANKSASDIDPKTEVLVADVELLGLVEVFLIDSEVVATVVLLDCDGFLRGSLFDDSVVVEVVEAVVSVVAGVEVDDDDPNKILAIPVGKPLKPSMGPDVKKISFKIKI